VLVLVLVRRIVSRLLQTIRIHGKSFLDGYNIRLVEEDMVLDRE